jgi:hypothetical protein
MPINLRAQAIFFCGCLVVFYLDSEEIMKYQCLCEFYFLKLDLILDSNLCTCSLKGLKIREGHLFPFFCHGKISFGGGITQP